MRDFFHYFVFGTLDYAKLSKCLSLRIFFSNNLRIKLTLDSYFFQGITFKQVWVHYVLIACVLNMNSLDLGMM